MIINKVDQSPTDWRRIAITVLGSLMCWLVTERAEAQIQIMQGGVPVSGRLSTKDEDLERQLYIKDRLVVAQLNRAETALQEGQLKDAVELLHGLHSREEDMFLLLEVDGGATRYVSLKEYAGRLLQGLDGETREIYETLHGTQAAVLLESAITHRNMPRLNAVASQYAHTKAGQRAAYLLAISKYDQGLFFEAAQDLNRLKSYPLAARQLEPYLSLSSAVAWAKAGYETRAREGFDALSQGYDLKRLSVGGESFTDFFDGQSPHEWVKSLTSTEQLALSSIRQLPNWLQAGGNAARNGNSEHVAPIVSLDDQSQQVTSIELLESFPGDDDTREIAGALLHEQLVEQTSQHQFDEFLTLPCQSAIAVDDQVVVRSLDGLKAFDRLTGKFLWSSSRIPGDLLPTLCRDIARRPVIKGRVQTSGLELFLRDRAWLDETTGTISSDGRFVYAVERCGVTRELKDPGDQGGFQQNTFGNPGSNVLAAYDLKAEGRLAMVSGFSSSEDDLDNVFVLGPPLILGDRLFVIGEVDAEERLYELKTDLINNRFRIVWSQTLVSPPIDIHNDPVRRLAGLSPTYSGGVLVCPTCAGSVVAVDPDRRELLWEYRYDRNVRLPAFSQRDRLLARVTGGINATLSRDGEDRWIAGEAIIHGDKAILTPRDSDELHCLDLITGEVVWRKDREDGLYVATVEQDQILMVGRSGVTARTLLTGDQAWPYMTSLPMPSGIGLRCGSVYHIPLSSGEIATIALDDGRLLVKSPVPAKAALGNLCAGNGSLISVTPDRLTLYPPSGMLQEELSQSITSHPNDSRYFALRGTLRLHQGDRSDAVKDLRSSLALSDNSPARQVLMDYLIDGLRLNADGQQSALRELEKLAGAGGVNLDLLRIRADANFLAGELAAAFQDYLKVIRSLDDASLRTVDSVWKATELSQLKPRLLEIYQRADEPLKQKLDTQLLKTIAEVEKSGDQQRIERLADALRGVPGANQFVFNSIEALVNRGEVLEAERWLLELIPQADEETTQQASKQALLKLADIYLVTGQAIAARNTLSQINLPHNGGELSRELAQLQNQLRTLPSLTEFTNGSFEGRYLGLTPLKSSFAVAQIGAFPPEFDTWNFSIDANRTSLIAEDGTGRTRWTVNVEPRLPTGDPRANITGNSMLIDGHLMVVILTDRFIVFDLLEDPGRPRRLWEETLRAPGDAEGSSGGIRLESIIQPNGQAKVVLVDANGRQFGSVGPIRGDSIVYQIGEALHSADALTGNVRWRRKNINPGSLHFGDHEYVISIEPGADEAIVYRAIDGRKLGKTALPPRPHWRLTSGRYLIEHDPLKTQTAVRCLDLAKGSDLWSRLYSPGTKLSAVGGSELAVLEPNGNFELLSTENGHTIAAAKIPNRGNRQPQDIHVVRTKSHYVVMLTESHLLPDGKARVLAMGDSHRIINGSAHGIDRVTGELVWSRELSGKGFTDRQPRGLPLLFFNGRVRRNNFTRDEYHLAAIDVRTGEVLFDELSALPVISFEVEGNPATNTIDATFRGRRFRFEIDPPAKEE
ncbi:outer membrane protein assembly factor BamB family protein [Calycomorphotria hydatis]|uniref:Outer membrane protein assembly factor BamB n=1 Tax=Calycomorphotria hydatis TaxID=2528027 RepID=A0A517TBQ0_9PLAN|nr:PQQ-binding-like beta-propeller repeat protein [Calycomorphotria hydatis]QDT65798.1 Outer membrane protein assembly factor BamB [Calycomorphotria hydatis]